MLVIDPTTDVPECEECRGPMVTRCHRRGQLTSPTLKCCACGELFDVTPEEWERAARADAAWRAEERARMEGGR